MAQALPEDSQGLNLDKLTAAEPKNPLFPYRSRFFNLGTTDREGWIILVLWGTLLCVAGYLVASLDFVHEMPIVPSTR